MFGILNSLKNENLKINVDQVESLLKSWEIASKSNLEDSTVLKRENLDLKKQLKELKQIYLTAVQNPTEEELKDKKGESSVSSSSLVAQQLLKKVLLYEEQNNLLKLEKKQIIDTMMNSNKSTLDHINILYSIVLEKLTC